MKGRSVMLVVLSCGLLGLASVASADTTLNQGLISSTIFRKMRSVQYMIRSGQYTEALSQLGYLQGVTTSSYEGAVVHELYADLYIARGDYADALTALQPVTQQNVLPSDELHDVELTYGKLLVSDGKYQQGLEAMRSWMQDEQNPTPDALVTLAQAYAETGQCRQAIPYVKRAIDAASDPQQDWFQLWIACQYAIHDYGGAADALQATLAKFPDEPQYWQQLGQSYAQAGDNSKALAVYALMYRQGLVRQAQDYLTLATLYMRNGLPYQSAGTLQEGLQSGVLPATEANYMLLASAWQSAGDLDRTLAALTDAVKVAKGGDPYVAQAQIYIARHEWFSVIDATKKALAKGGLRRPGEAWLLQGIADVQNHQYDDGTTALREAVKYDDSRSQAQAWLRYLNSRGAG